MITSSRFFEKSLFAIESLQPARHSEQLSPWQDISQLPVHQASGIASNRQNYQGERPSLELKHSIEQLCKERLQRKIRHHSQSEKVVQPIAQELDKIKRQYKRKSAFQVQHEKQAKGPAELSSPASTILASPTYPVLASQTPVRLAKAANQYARAPIKELSRPSKQNRAQIKLTSSKEKKSKQQNKCSKFFPSINMSEFNQMMAKGSGVSSLIRIDEMLAKRKSRKKFLEEFSRNGNSFDAYKKLQRTERSASIQPIITGRYVCAIRKPQSSVVELPMIKFND